MGIQASNDASAMNFLQSPLNLQNVLNSVGLIRSPVRYLAPWVQLSPEPRKIMK